MSEQTFKVVFKGKIDRKIDPQQAKANFGKLFKLAPEKVERMFDGTERVIKKSLSMDKASHFRAVLKKAGIKVSLVKNEVVEAEKTVDDWELADPGAVILRPVQAPETHIETSHISVDITFDELEEKPNIDPPEVDIDDIVIDQSEDPVVEPKEVEIPEFDLSKLKVEKAGTIIVKSKKIETPDIPMTDMDLDEPGIQLVTKKKIEEPEIDISNISLDVN